MTDARAFRGFRFPVEVIPWAVRWYLQFPVSYRDLERMLADRGVQVDHTTMYRRVQRFAPELGKRVRQPTLDPNVWTRMKAFGELPAGEYIGRRRRVLAWADSVDARLAGIDAFATPTIAITAPALEEVAELDDHRRHNIAASRNAAILSLLDVCAITLPVALDAAGVPVGLQLAARRGRERDLVGIAAAVERRLGTARQRLGTPPLVASP
jgi:Asp-tRNA(Asn)/Glu-tRNA(Gln) amidotransferase A subunit family amidase